MKSNRALLKTSQSCAHGHMFDRIKFLDGNNFPVPRLCCQSLPERHHRPDTVYSSNL